MGFTESFKAWPYRACEQAVNQLTLTGLFCGQVHRLLIRP